MTDRSEIADARRIARAAMMQNLPERRQDTPLVAAAFAFPKVKQSRVKEAIAPSSKDDEFVDKLVAINRVAKVFKGGRQFGFAALVVVGDQKGAVGYGTGTAKEVPEAIRKAKEAAKRDMVFVPLRDGRTLFRDLDGRHGTGKVMLRSADAGTGIVASGPMRAIFESLGVRDVIAKSTGSNNKYNMVRATFDALKNEHKALSKDPKSTQPKTIDNL